MSTTKPSSTTKGDNASDILCFCVGLTDSVARDYLRRPGNSIDGLIDETKVGTVCTACLADLDVLVGEILDRQTAADTAKIRIERDSLVTNGWLLRRKYLESGFLLNRDGIETEVAFANYGLKFETNETQVPFDYEIKVMDNAGKLRGRRSGHCPPGEAVRFRFAEMSECPPEGWFLLALRPEWPGLEGSMRPQLLITGPGFSTSVHTQPHVLACRGKSVMTLPGAEGYATSASLINAHHTATSITVTSHAIVGNKAGAVQGMARLRLERNEARIVALDEILPPPLPGAPLRIAVTSDHPIRKHVINHLAEGRLSIDHFPNSQ